MKRVRKIVCSTCRRRKSKCDGGTPCCSTCLATNSPCRYEKSPSIAYVRQLQDRIEELECMHKTDSYAPPASFVAGLDHDEYRDPISLDASGDVQYHNSLSAIHEAPPDSSSRQITLIYEPPVVNGVAQDGRNEEMRKTLRANAAAQRNFEVEKLQIAATYVGLPKELTNVLLQLHWCWLHPAFLFVYRPAFTQGLSVLRAGRDSSSYCSLTLLKVLCAHSCRFIYSSETVWGISQHEESSQKLADRLMSNATISLAMEILQPPTIATVQALLQQSARDIACGQSSQAWLYSGMAFRMAIDLGLHISPDKLCHHTKSLSPEDVEIRKRLFWSLYSWDKHISLYLGRMPNFVMGAESISLDFLDDFTETEPWQPFYGSDSSVSQSTAYTPRTAHTISCFTSLCKLCKILSRLMFELYSPHQPSKELPSNVDTKSAAFVEINEELQDWWNKLPEFLKINTAQASSPSPPPHIASLNLMYHTTLILLHRPLVHHKPNFKFPAVQNSWKICQTATSAIYKLLQTYVETFGFSHITYLNSYCTYTAATTAVYQLEVFDQLNTRPPDSQPMWDELKFLINILQRTSSVMPGLNRSLDIIRTRIKKIFERQSAARLESLFMPDIDNISRKSLTHATPVLHTIIPSSSQHTMQEISTFSSSSPVEELNFLSNHESRTTASGIPSREYEEWLPAFPDQGFCYGSELNLHIQENLTPETRSALLQSSLDPHLQLDLSIQHDAFDYGFPI
ncbi:hypothetical protein N7510_010027 [Penicillium lagena]|uniref:uncharacterized protein n=1 Tax=Penicillium lagena TaxID=94218 RepID=UPI0025403B0B|nr:uncharacterized protein N7510_010027 [Penicillium lagena]KAJ5604873.1 hypothetical protein N7510_010027 [Penicillium lagena]